MRILHIIDRLSAGGPTRTLLAQAKLHRQTGVSDQRRVLVLQQPAYPIARALAAQAGVELVFEPDSETTRAAVADADIVIVHFWNNPLIYEFLRTPLPPCRLIVWIHILGSAAPQILPRHLVAFSDECVVTTPASLQLPAFPKQSPPPMIFSICDPDRLRRFEPQPHNGFNVTYIGSLIPQKLHPDFVTMSAGVRIPQARFIVCGERPEPLIEQAHALGASARFEFRGFVEAIQPVLAISDVFGYPLCTNTYATSEKSLQEAQWMGVPPVVFPYGGIPHLVADGESGLIVHTAEAYQAAIEHLYDNPQERRRLSEGAREWARIRFDPTALAKQAADLYETIEQRPKREHSWQDAGDPTESGWFVEALGDSGASFALSKYGMAAEQVSADRQIAASPEALVHGEGGILHYRNVYPHDPYLHYWAALVLMSKGRRDAALREWDAAQACGLPDAGSRAAFREIMG
jgi:glycosyltransferase involved in cell wall biosynthesis